MNMLRLKRHAAFPGLKGMDLAKEVTTDSALRVDAGQLVHWRADCRPANATNLPYHVVA